MFESRDLKEIWNRKQKAKMKKDDMEKGRSEVRKDCSGGGQQQNIFISDLYIYVYMCIHTYTHIYIYNLLRKSLEFQTHTPTGQMDSSIGMAYSHLLLNVFKTEQLLSNPTCSVVLSPLMKL